MRRRRLTPSGTHGSRRCASQQHRRAYPPPLSPPVPKTGDTPDAGYPGREGRAGQRRFGWSRGTCLVSRAWSARKQGRGNWLRRQREDACAPHTLPTPSASQRRTPRTSPCAEGSDGLPGRTANLVPQPPKLTGEPLQPFGLAACYCRHQHDSPCGIPLRCARSAGRTQAHQIHPVVGRLLNFTGGSWNRQWHGPQGFPRSSQSSTPGTAPRTLRSDRRRLETG